MSGPSISVIAEAVSQRFDVGIIDLRGPKKHRRISWPRHVAFWLCSRAGHSYAEIGRRFIKTHAAVIGGRRKIEARIAEDRYPGPQAVELAKRLNMAVSEMLPVKHREAA